MTTTCTQSECTASATTTCSVCATALCPTHTILGHPLITVGQLLRTVFNTALRAPGLLSDLLFKEMDQVPYCAECREAIGGRRQVEQMKLAGMMLAMLLLVVSVPLYLVLT